MVRIKLFESFNKENYNRYEQNIKDILVELEDKPDNIIGYRFEFGYNSLHLIFKSKYVLDFNGDDMEDDMEEYQHSDFFKLGDISEYIYQIIDYLKEIHSNLLVTYDATDPVGDPFPIEVLDDSDVNYIDNHYVVINSNEDQCSGLVYLSINFKW